MINLSEAVADSYRSGHRPKANPGNPVTSRRRRLFSTIKERTGGDPQAELDYAMRIIGKERPRVEAYVISKNEVPATELPQLIMQAYKLRSAEIDNVAQMLGVSEGEAGIFLENDESDSTEANSPEQDNFIGELFAPVGIAAKHISESDSFVDAGLVQGVVNTVGGIVDKASLKRAAENKPAGLAGILSGGKAEYEILRAYLQKTENKDEKQKVLMGIITSPSQLRGYGGAAGTTGGLNGVAIGANNVIDAIAAKKKKEFLQKNLPIIIIGVVILIVVTILIVKSANKSK